MNNQNRLNRAMFVSSPNRGLQPPRAAPDDLNGAGQVLGILDIIDRELVRAISQQLRDWHCKSLAFFLGDSHLDVGANGDSTWKV